MQAAITASKRGHEVTLLEKERVLGGQINIAKVPPDKTDLESIVPWFEQELINEGVKVKMEHEADVESILALSPNAVLHRDFGDTEVRCYEKGGVAK